MTTRFTTILLVLMCGLVTGLYAQSGLSPAPAGKGTGSIGTTPNDMWEVGLNVGHFFYAGDVTFNPGYGVGLHVRKSIDYVFSLRFDGLYGSASGENDGGSFQRRFESTYMSGTVFGVMSLNSLKWNKPVRSTSLYFMAGGGANNFETMYDEPIRDGSPQVETITQEGEWALHFAVGGGIGFRVNKRFNIAVEHQAAILFGSRADLADGYDPATNFRDIINFTSISLNYNLGNPNKNTEPLYWINPIEVVLDDVRQLQQQNSLAIEDSDGDGVIDAVDQEPNTPPDVPVDTKGRTLDSDRDGIPDYKDKEPYYVPRPGEVVDGAGVVTNPAYAPAAAGTVTGGGVSEDRVRELIDEALDEYRLTEEGSAVAEWFLPMIHFGVDSYTIKYSDYGTLAGIARMMKGNKNLRLVVTGFTDQTGPEAYNSQLSYQRARAVIEHLQNNHSIGRGRFVLEYLGQEGALVPSTSSYMNRRVEFRVAAPDDVEMDPPAPEINNTKGSGY